MKQLIQNITTSISLSRALARRLVLLLAVLLVGVGNVWGQNVTTTLKASGATLSNSNKTATWTDSYVTFTLTGNKAMSRTGSGDNAYFILSPNTTYTLTWTVRNQNANAFNVVSSASATTHINRTSTASPATFWDEDKVAIVFSTNNNNNGSARHDNYNGFLSDGFNLPNQLNGSGELKFTTEKASQSHKALFVKWTASFEYRLRNITISYSLYRKFHYSATVKKIKEDGTSVDGTYGDAYASFTNGQYSNSSVSGVTTASTVDQTSISKQVYFYANPNGGNDKVFIGWKSSLNATSYLSTDPYYDQELTNITSQDIDHPANLTLYAVFGDKYVRQIDYKTNESLIQLKVDDIVNNAFTISNCGGSNVPDDGNVDGFDRDEHEFYYVISSTVDDNVEGCNPNHEGDVITYDAVNRTVTAWNAGEATITFYQRGTETIASNMPNGVSFKFKVSKYTPSIIWNSDYDVNHPENWFYFNSTIPDVVTSIKDEKGVNVPSELISYSSDHEDVATFEDNTITTFNVQNKNTTFTVSSDENYKLLSKSWTLGPISPKKKSNHVPFTLNNWNDYNNTFHILNNNTLPADNASWDSSNGLLLGTAEAGAGFQWSNDDGRNSRYYYSVIAFEGIPDSLYFNYKTYSYTLLITYKATLSSDLKDLTQVIEPIWSVEESADGYYWSSVWENQTNNDQWTYNVGVQLSPTTRFLRFMYEGNYGGWFENIRVTELHQFEATPSPIDFGIHGTKDGIFEELISFTHANANCNVSVSIVGDDASAFTVDTRTIAAGYDVMHTDYVRVSYIGADVKTHNAKVVFKDDEGAGSHETKVVLIGKRINKYYVPIFTWNPRELPYYYEDSIPFVFSSNRNETNITITSDNSVASVEKREDGTYTLLIGQKPATEGVVKITATQEGNDSIQGLTEVYTFTPRTKPPFYVPFKMSSDKFATGDFHYNQQGWAWLGGGWKDISDPYGWENPSIRLGGSSSSVTDGPSGEYGDKYVIYEFGGQPDSLFFNYRTNNSWATGADWYVEESSDGEYWSRIWRQSSRSNSYQDKDIRLALKPTTRYLKFCYSGNFAGYFKDITVTALDGIYYLRDADGKYLSRGGNEGKMAVVDDYGIAVRKTRRTTDNTSYYTRLQFMDQFTINNKFIGKNGPTNTTSGIDLIETSQGAESFKLNFALATSLSSKVWMLEEPKDHQIQMERLKDEQAVNAAAEFKEDVPSLAILRLKLSDVVGYGEDYAKEDISLHNSENVTASISELFQEVASNVNPLPSFVKRVPEGLYRVRIKAFNRMCDNDNAYKAYLKEYDSSVAYVYAKNGDNDQHTQIASVYTSRESEDYNPKPKVENDFQDFNAGYQVYFPNGLTAAAKAFQDANRYENDVYIYVHADGAAEELEGTGILEYGLKSPSNGECANWLCYKDFSITRYYRKEYTFDNHTRDGKWSTIENWLDENNSRATQLPREVHKTRIIAPVTVDIANAVTNTMTIGNSSTVTVSPKGGLAVGMGGIDGATKNNLVVQSSTSNVGFIKVSPRVDQTMMPEATVQYATKSTLSTGANKDATWQYFGTPVQNMDAYNFGYNVWLYLWSEKNGWTRENTPSSSTVLTPFAGYAITQYGQPTYNFKGQLINTNKQVNLTHTNSEVNPNGMDGDNLFANSYSAPIDVKKFTAEDFSPIDAGKEDKDLDMTFYLFNSGSWNQWDKGNGAAGQKNDAPGQYLAIPALSAKDFDETEDMTTIPPMQGVYVRARNNNAKIYLDYSKHVWETKSICLNEPMRAPKRRDDVEVSSSSLTRRIRICVASENSGADRIYLFENYGYSSAYENGYDSEKVFADNNIVGLYTNEPAGKLSVSADNSLVGKYVGIKAGSDSIYTLTFTSIIGEELALHDLMTDSIIPMTVGRQYEFSTIPDVASDFRFQIVEMPAFQEDNKTATSIENNMDVMKMWVYNNVLYTNEKGALYIYDPSGKLVYSTRSNSGYEVDLSFLVKGVYIVKCGKIISKVIVTP